MTIKIEQIPLYAFVKGLEQAQGDASKAEAFIENCLWKPLAGREYILNAEGHLDTLQGRSITALFNNIRSTLSTGFATRNPYNIASVYEQLKKEVPLLQGHALDPAYIKLIERVTAIYSKEHGELPKTEGDLVLTLGTYPILKAQAEKALSDGKQISPSLQKQLYDVVLLHLEYLDARPGAHGSRADRFQTRFATLKLADAEEIVEYVKALDIAKEISKDFMRVGTSKAIHTYDATTGNSPLATKQGLGATVAEGLVTTIRMSGAQDEIKNAPTLTASWGDVLDGLMGPEFTRSEIDAKDALKQRLNLDAKQGSVGDKIPMLEKFLTDITRISEQGFVYDTRYTQSTNLAAVPKVPEDREGRIAWRSSHIFRLMETIYKHMETEQFSEGEKKWVQFLIQQSGLADASMHTFGMWNDRGYFQNNPEKSVHIFPATRGLDILHILSYPIILQETQTTVGYCEGKVLISLRKQQAGSSQLSTSVFDWQFIAGPVKQDSVASNCSSSAAAAAAPASSAAAFATSAAVDSEEDDIPPPPPMPVDVDNVHLELQGSGGAGLPILRLRELAASNLAKKPSGSPPGPALAPSGSGAGSATAAGLFALPARRRGVTSSTFVAATGSPIARSGSGKPYPSIPVPQRPETAPVAASDSAFAVSPAAAEADISWLPDAEPPVGLTLEELEGANEELNRLFGADDAPPPPAEEENRAATSVREEDVAVETAGKTAIADEPAAAKEVAPPAPVAKGPLAPLPWDKVIVKSLK